MDLSVLAIALVTYYVLMSNDGDKALRSVVDSFRWILLVVWTIPLLTSLAGLVLVGYGPAGNWCWIAADPKAENPIPLNTVTSVRFGLTQGPRMVIFLIILFTYLRVFFRLNNRFNLTRKQTSIRNQHNNQNNGVDTQQINNNQQDTDYCGGNYSLPVSITGMTISQVKSEDNFNTNKMHSSIQSLHQAAHMGSEYSTHIEEQLREEEARNKDVMAAIYRMMLYPLIYLFFWICGLANRIVEATGNQSDVTRMMQSFSKFLPMVDAIVYCWTIKHQIREACRRN